MVGRINRDKQDDELAQMSATDRIRWGLETLPGRVVLSSSFGNQAAVLLHMTSSIQADIPVVFIDTGYHFAETYQFVEQLTKRLDLNLQIFSASRSAAWQETIEGKRWEQGEDGLRRYNHENKVEPMRRALDELQAGVWISGLRRVQSASRSNIAFRETRWGVEKLHPLADWSDYDIHQYLTRYALPYHPLREAGYISIGDWLTTRAVGDVTDAEDVRFGGYFRECGLHR